MTGALSRLLIFGCLLVKMSCLVVATEQDCSITDIKSQEDLEKIDNCKNLTAISMIGTNIKYERLLGGHFFMLETVGPKKKATEYSEAALIEFIGNKYLQWEEGEFHVLRKLHWNESETEAPVLIIMNNERVCVNITSEKKLAAAARGMTMQIQRCSCSADYLNDRQLKSGNCRVIYGVVDIKKLQRFGCQLQYLRNVQEIRGRLIISGTSLRNVKFLKNLKSVTCSDCANDTAAIEVTNNPELLELHFDALFETYQGAGRVILVKNNTKLKMTDSDRVQMYDLPRNGVGYFSKHANPVMLDLDPCQFHDNVLTEKNIEQLKECVKVRGNITIDERSNAITDWQHLLLIRVIYGCLLVRNTNLTSLRMFRSLREISCNTTSALRVENNSLLFSIDLPLVNVSSAAPMVFSNNDKLCSTEVLRFQQQLIRAKSPSYTVNATLETCRPTNQPSSAALGEGGLQKALPTIVLLVSFFIFIDLLWLLTFDRRTGRFSIRSKRNKR